MANRAYLFSSENGNFRLDRDETPYYDSRWNIPLLWFLFFEETSIKMRSNFDYDEPRNTWQEAILVENKDLAIERFEKMKPMIKSLLPVSDVDIEGFVSGIGN